ncbi:MAG: putative lysophosphatidic acid acyltransferase [Pseudobdellovibrio sp.]|jgi:1-acyl-sn-glycerol-3-phosphate acyltransferase|nr:putative lysophosphatidic acid acyltransferase [Pseudobdellovibrio sp.]
MKALIILRSLVATIVFPFTVLILGSVVIVSNLIFGNTRLDDKIVMLWAKITCFMSGVKVVVEGRENIPKQGCLFLFNHASFFDIFAMAAELDGLRFGAKAELFKIPVFGRVMRMIRTLPIARNNREEVIKIYDEAKVRFAHGEQFALSPEGGRFYNPDHLFPFKAGPFLFAMSAAVPLVPVVVNGAYEALPKGSFLFNTYNWRHTITLKILEPVQTAGYNQEQRKELQKIVYERMDKYWHERPRIAQTL